ncbi:amidase [Pseudoroseomonas deserti]|uniref:Amidase n=1 Tax=Teichococcus deserti TaxID=1817963 RepID=A0A1V2H7B9_9PROT|nr:amidase [Pseudoroseomonas deserti]ONG58306.1 amidase [Pseudoroseomonas deserti]
MTHPADLSATEALRRIAAGQLTADALWEACQERIAEREPVVRAFTARTAAVPAAIAGPLGGLPVGVKDVLDTGDLPTEYGSPIWTGHQPKADAFAVSRARSAGGRVIGKTVTTEFATRRAGPTTNPHGATRTPGGSSSGSAAGVAAGFFPLAFGTQTAGSILRPAAYCGVAGFKPSHGLIHRAGMKVMAESLDTIGVFGKRAADCALFAGVLTNQDLSGVAETAPRIALCSGPAEGRLTPETRTLLDDTAHRLSAAGAKVTTLVLPEAVLAVDQAHPTVMHGETLQALAWERAHHRGQMSEVLNERLDWAEKMTAATLAQGRATFAAGRAAFADLMADHDILLTASAPGEAPEGLDWTGEPVCNALWTALHGPCITLDAARGPAGMPLGIQLVAPFGWDAALLGWAQWVETVIGK